MDGRGITPINAVATRVTLFRRRWALFGSSVFAVLLASLPLSDVFAADAAIRSRTSVADQRLLVETLRVSVTEVELARMALTHASSEEVRQVARQLDADHTRIQQDLRGVAGEKGLAVPQDAAGRSSLSDLLSLRGTAFDRAYMDHVRAELQALIARCEQAEQSGLDDAVRQFASTTLVTLRGQLKMVLAAQATTRPVTR